ncbi:hypothetical protein TUM19329_09940 [Legionella antarctica]|uniref:ATPase dynein-related AAA domain-containing protein n=1 Tax=Legionella antarctica TaxID=2708020 RepID=A0A6F8T349_9GAMM|nr:AAA family ATPase [Legionella antarctica]BCA94633.1 hypothetical protein TUM19329_09940 [Legionella antarctica]
MPITSNYTLQVESSERTYCSTANNGGVIDVGRMLQNKPFWRQPQGMTLEMNKTLIINDPAIACWDHNQCIVAAERFNVLQQEGFKIYFYRKGAFSELNTSSLKSPKSIVDATPVTDLQISQLAAIKLRLSYDHLLVLNHEHLVALMQGTDDDWLNLNSFQHIDLRETNINTASLTTLLKTFGDRIKSLNLSRCVNLKEGTLPGDIDLVSMEELIITDEFDNKCTIPALNQEYSPRENNLSADSIKHLLQSTRILKTLKLGRGFNRIRDIITDLEFPFLERIDLSSSNITSMSLNTLLAKTTCIKELNLSDCMKLDDNQLFDHLNTGLLETLDLSGSNITCHSLGRLLAKATQLKILDLNSCYGLDDEPLPNDFDLSALETLNLSRSNITSQSLGRLLAKVTKLTILDLRGCLHLEDNSLPNHLNLASLEELDLNGTNITSQSLGRILSKATKLKILDLRDCEELYNNPLPEYLDLSSLETLDLGGTNNISSQSLGRLLAKATKLKILDLSGSEVTIQSLGTIVAKTTKLTKLDLSSCNILVKNQLPVNVDLSALETLDLTRSSITSQSLGIILAKASQLKVLNLTNCYQLANNPLLHDLDLFNLENLSLSHSNMTSQTLGRILAKTTQLKVLDLTNCNNLDDTSLPHNLDFSSLEELDLRDSNIGCQSLGSILAQATKLRMLDLTRCPYLADNQIPDYLSFSSLEELDLSGSNLTSQSLGRILANTKKLTKLNLSGCDNLANKQLPNDLDLPTLETLDLTRSSITSQSLGRILAKTTQLKILNLTNCYNLDDNQLANDLNLSSLETLNLSHSNITCQSLGRILAKATKLKVLNLTNCSNLGDNQLPQDLNLSSLEELDLTESKINCQSLDRILVKTTKLTKLNLGDCNNLADIQLPKDLDLLSLEMLNLSGSNITGLSLGRLMAKATKLKILDLRGCRNLDVNQITNDLNLYALKKLDLSRSKITSLSLGRILARTTKLKILNLSDCSHLAETQLPNNLDLSNLESLSLSNITSQSLVRLLTKTMNLKKLKLKNCHNIAPIQLPNEFDLPALKTLNLNHSNMTSQYLNRILANTTRLKKLKLKNCYNLANIQLPNELDLSSLKELNLAGSSITSDPLYRILAKTTAKLTKLELKNRHNLDESDFTDNMDREPLGQITLEKSAISPDLLKKIKAKALHQITTDYPGELSSIPTSSDKSISNVRSADDTKSLDADTQFNPNLQLHLTRIFYAKDEKNHPCPTEYRLEAFNKITVNDAQCGLNNAFNLSNISLDVNIEARNITRSLEDLKSQLTEENQYYGIQKINLSTTWQFLASLDAEEIMTHYHLSHPDEVEIGYSTRDNMYCIRRSPDSSQTNNPITIGFILNIPQKRSQDSFPHGIQQKIGECSEFTAKPLKITQDHPTGADYLSALQEQKVGACRHRALIFKAWMDEHHPAFKTRIINNDCHSYVETKHQEHWITCNLGGYPADLMIDEPKKPERIPKKYFQPDNVEEKFPLQTHLYMQHLLSSPGIKKLIHVSSSQSLNGFRHHLQQQCKSTSRPCFYIHSPQDLICSAPYIKRDGTTGLIKRGPGGPLHQFLMEHSKDGSNPVLIVNYDRFSATDIVRFNALLDKERLADGSPLPEKATVIGLMNPNKPGAYHGADFRSRFAAIRTNKLPDGNLVIPPVTTEERNLTQDAYSINLYGGADWEDRLLGHWVLQGNTLQFVEGALLAALKNKNSTIELKNAPWANEAFQCFWQGALLFGSFQSQGRRYQLPKDFKLHKSEGYSFHNMNITINEDEDIPTDALALNRGTLAHFLSQYHCDNARKTIQYGEGLLALNHNNTVSLYLSDSLSLSSWALFLDACQQHKVSINLTLAPGVTLPKELAIDTKKRTAAAGLPWSSEHLPDTACVHSTDMDVTLATMSDESAIIIDVSEVLPANLLMRLDGTFDDKTLTFSFNEQEGALLSAIKANKNVILKGRIQEDLRHALANFLLQRQHDPKPKGRLIVICDQAHLFPMVSSFTHEVRLDEKEQLLLPHQFSRELIAKHSASELQAMTRHQKLHPDEPGENAWQGLRTISLSVTPGEVDLNDAEQVAAEFDEQRLNKVAQVLMQSPFVFLAGMTGVGKTTFIHEVWKKIHSRLYLGEASLLAWAKDTNSGIKTLFIDEANISSRQWSDFEGLFHKPPRILIGNQVITLSEQHKVIFAGNPLSYGGDRQIPSLFARHGNSLIFDPMPPAYLYVKLLKPILDNSELNSKELAQSILEAAQYLSALDRTTVLITPRELSMMALLTVSYCKQNPESDSIEVARYYAYNLAKNYVPDHAKQAFQIRFKPQEALQRNAIEKPDKLLITTTNQPAFETLCDLLNLRALRQMKSIQPEGGLGGLILEGEPGLGKTELVVKTLLAHGLEKGNINDQALDKQVFYVMPVSMALAEKEKMLLKAFHEGAPVVIDEINSAPMMERLLNDLLMGKDPNGNLANKPGFMVIGTQNPPTMAGRTSTSTALEHRMLQITLTQYPKNEMIEILTYKGLPQNISQDMVEEFLSLQQKSLQESSPTLCFRDLLQRAEQELLALSKLSQAVRTSNKLEINIDTKAEAMWDSSCTLFRPMQYSSPRITDAFKLSSTIEEFYGTDSEVSSP